MITKILEKLPQAMLFGVFMAFFLFLGGVCSFSQGFGVQALLTEYLPVSLVCAVAYIAVDEGIARIAANQDKRKAEMAAAEAEKSE